MTTETFRERGRLNAPVPDLLPQSHPDVLHAAREVRGNLNAVLPREMEQRVSIYHGFYRYRQETKLKR